MRTKEQELEAELMAFLLTKPTAGAVREDQIKADILMRDVGCALAQFVNSMLADLVEKIDHGN